MKKMNYTIIAAAAGLLIGSAGQVDAQSQAVGDDGIAASPKLRQMLNERQARTAAPVLPAEVTTYQGGTSEDLAASPKVQHMRSEEKAVGAPPSSTANVAR